MPRAAKISAGLTVALLLIGLAVFAVQIERIKEVGDLEIVLLGDAVSESGDGTCVWVVEFELENTTEITLRLRNVRAAITRSSSVSGRIIEDGTGTEVPELAPGATTVARLTFELDSCPTDSSEITHDLFRVIYNSTEFGNRTQTFRF